MEVGNLQSNTCIPVIFVILAKLFVLLPLCVLSPLASNEQVHKRQKATELRNPRNPRNVPTPEHLRSTMHGIVYRYMPEPGYSVCT